MSFATVLPAAVGVLAAAMTLAARLVVPSWFVRVAEREFAAPATRLVGAAVYFGCGFVPLLVLAAVEPGRPARGWAVAVAAGTTATTLAAALVGGLVASRNLRRAEAALPDDGLAILAAGDPPIRAAGHPVPME